MEFVPAWRELTGNRFILDIVGVGLTIAFRSVPKLSGGFLPFSLPRVGSPKRAALFDEIRKMEEKGAVVPLGPGASPGFYSNLFLVSKATGGFRPVINLKPLNKMIHNPKFRMETIQSVVKAVSPGDWTVSIDLRDAYFHIPIHPDYQKFLRFAVSESEAYQFRALPFGLSTAPRIFTMVLREMAQHLHCRGIKIHLYLDDWLIRSQDPVTLSDQLQYVRDLAQKLGLIINLEKSELVPTQQFVYLGVEFDTDSLTIRPTCERVECM